MSIKLPMEPSPDIVVGRSFSRLPSWLAYNARVLAMGGDDALPLLERVRMLAIARSNLDDFLQVRVAELQTQLDAARDDGDADLAQSLAEEHAEVRSLVRAQYDEADQVWTGRLRESLAARGVAFASVEELGLQDRQYLSAHFRDRLFPVLTPLAVDGTHSFANVTNLALNIVARVGSEPPARPRLACVEVPAWLHPLVRTPGGALVLLEDVITAHLDWLFPGLKVLSEGAFRVTRRWRADVQAQDAGRLLEAVQVELRRRQRSGPIVRLEVQGGGGRLEVALNRKLGLADSLVLRPASPLNPASLAALYDLEREDLKAPRWRPVRPQGGAARAAEGRGWFDVVSGGDLLVQHPYESFADTVASFLQQAASDPAVLAIKQTLYRTGGDSPVTRSLVQAAGHGKHVTALIEIRARGDEGTNVALSNELRAAGVNVVFGVRGLKTHAKLTLVVRNEGDRIRSYVHVGTGNYHPVTANAYEDLGLLSADPSLAADAADLFNLLTGYSQQRRYSRLLVAPVNLRAELTRLIEEQAHPGGRIVIKVNNLLDPDVIESLYTASEAGAEIDLIVRSVCGLRPGVRGLSHRIRVRSLVGRFLEHSRIFRFGDGGEARYFIGSTDLMQRNLDRRIEVMVPVSGPRLTSRLDEVVGACLEDTCLAWELGSDGSWRRLRGLGKQMDAQQWLMRRALEREQGRAPADLTGGRPLAALAVPG